ncbi:type 2 periplasmic-binding domain-containing protein [Klebsiella michiganensis]|uniref:hypothetical protein n=1 Tax=Klebsiella michiganensis TaxID=1134687 RepID=UPI00192D994E|nr:hypothetical protein [Klebsiella michiganensis]
MKTPPILRSLILSLALLASVPSFAAVKKEFNICWTIYAGWMPWGTISNEKIIDKWASKYGIKINIVQLNDYIESINQYTAGQFDGCTMTNMDALTIPAAGGVDTTALITGSYSDGTDLAGYRAQLKTTHLFWTPADTLTFISSPALAKTMQRVAQFSFDKGLLGEGAQSADFIGMTFPGGVTVGDTANSKLRFDDSYLKLAAAGQL